VHPAYAKPELLAVQPNEVWSWDIMKLKGPDKWSWYHLYVILDIFSRYVVGWMAALTCARKHLRRGGRAAQDSTLNPIFLM
jgi:transposase InsO family protein